MLFEHPLLWAVHAFVVLAAPLIAGFFGTAVVLWFARWCAFYDVPNERSSHATPTPRSGGIGIVLGCLFAAILWHVPTRPPEVDLLVVSVSLACAVGLADDLRPLRPRVKMALLLCAVLPAAFAGRVEFVRDVPFAGDLGLAWAAWPLTLFWLTCYPHAFNFMDGLNGIAGITALVSSAVFVVAGAEEPVDGLLVKVALAAALATLGFLPWNFPRARIFLGDAGSLPLGLVLAWCAVRATASGALPFPASVLLLGPFLFDVTFTLVRRTIERKRLGEAHKEHLYQRLSRQWGSHAKVSLLYAAFSVVTGCLAVLYRHLDDLGRLLSLVLPLAAMLGFAALVLRRDRGGTEVGKAPS